MKNSAESTIVKVCGKWILTGEYAVLYQQPALVFPLPSHFMEINWQAGKNSGHGLDIEICPTSGCSSYSMEKLPALPPSELVSVFCSTLKLALQKISCSFTDLPSGVLQIFSNLPFGVGLGGSAVVCVLIGRLFQHFQWLKESDLFSFCHSLENVLHGKSSGLDVLASLKGVPLLYKKMKDNQNIDTQNICPRWKPLLFLSYSNCQNDANKQVLLKNKTTYSIKNSSELHSLAKTHKTYKQSKQKFFSTHSNIQKMELFLTKKPQLALELNKKMGQATQLVQESLLGDNISDTNRQALFKKAIDYAEHCFTEWGLIGLPMKRHISMLKQAGAVAVKPTGSGMDGCVLSLWDKKPPKDMEKQLIAVF